jgi:predicted nucleotidyltransferase
MIGIAIPYDAIHALCEKHHIRRLSLFGSVLRDDFRSDSDVDVLVEFEPGTRVTYLDLASIQLELSDLMGRSVDLGMPHTLSPYIRQRVLDQARVIYERA